MSQMGDRAVCLVFRAGELLVMGRHKDGRDYCVLPGGGVEPGESPETAALRELAEETGLVGTVQRHLWTTKHHDRVAHCFLVSIEPGPLTLAGPEAVASSKANRYTPRWLSLDLLEVENLQPESMRVFLREHETH